MKSLVERVIVRLWKGGRDVKVVIGLLIVSFIIPLAVTPVDCVVAMGKENTSIDFYLDNIRELEILAYKYDKDMARQNMLIFIRSGRYYTELWNLMSGFVDVDFENFVRENNPSLFELKKLNNLYTPLGEEIDFMHMIASICSFNFKYWNNIVLGGWGGDLAQLVQDTKSISTERTFIYSSIKDSFLGDSSFNSPDMYADLDALNVYSIYKTSSNYLADVIESYYKGLVHEERVRMFVGNQFKIQTFTREGLKEKVLEIMKLDGMMNLYYSAYGIDIIGKDEIKLEVACELFVDYLYDSFPKKDLKDYLVDYNKIMYVGDTQELKAVTIPNDSFYTQLELYALSSNVEIQEGLITAKEQGDLKLKVSIGGIDKVITIVVKEKESTTPKKKIEVKVEEKRVSSIKIGKGESLKVSANQKVSWGSSNNKIMTVTKGGTLKGRVRGSCYLSAQSPEGVKKRIKVVVFRVPTKVEIKTKNILLKKGQSKKLKVVFKKKEYSNKLKWSSNNKKIVGIDSKGFIKAKRRGKAVIAVRTYNKKTAVCVVRVR